MPPATAPDRRHRRKQNAFSAPRGIALQMTECDVVRRAGPPSEVQIGANERGDRTVTMTYAAADRPIYRFTGGRLSLIDRGAEPPPEPAKKKPAAKRQKIDNVKQLRRHSVIASS